MSRGERSIARTVDTLRNLAKDFGEKAAAQDDEYMRGLFTGLEQAYRISADHLNNLLEMELL